jgi:hypothetical protein
MVTTEKIVVNGQEHEVEAATLTLLAHDGLVEIEVPGRVRIVPDQTTKFFDNLSLEDWNKFRKDRVFLALMRIA